MVNDVDTFKRANGDYPEQIIFYRGGVGEGQIKKFVKLKSLKSSRLFPLKALVIHAR